MSVQNVVDNSGVFDRTFGDNKYAKVKSKNWVYKKAMDYFRQNKILDLIDVKTGSNKAILC